MHVDSLLTVMAYPDDAELWAGGVIAQRTSAGAAVTVAVPHTDKVRDQEAAAGAAILGATLRPLDTPTIPTLW